WTARLPLSRPSSDQKEDLPLSYGTYFDGLRTFLEKDEFSAIRTACGESLQKDLTLAEVEKVDIFLAKHGEFYHPARVEALICGQKKVFVLNVALTPTGRDGIEREFHHLKRLEAEFQVPYLPKVYRLGNVVAENKYPMRMFLGEWFEDYSEFHLSKDPADEKRKVVVWDVNYGNYYLSQKETRDVYRQAALILTSYYNLETFEQIYPWHHAAGDFVLKRVNQKIDLKLITVRNYAPFFDHKRGLEEDEGRMEILLNGMLVFFLNMMMRMRLDRVDGVEEMVWAGETALRGAVEGFFQGLATQPSISDLPGPIDDIFGMYLFKITLSELTDLCSAIVQKGYHPQAPETSVIKANLASHAACLHETLKRSQVQGSEFTVQG
ncbi:MAG: hypothetical protein V3S66_02235, partial [Desulfobacterales bacterium]